MCYDKTIKVILLLGLLGLSTVGMRAYAWKDGWAPEFACTQAKVRAVSQRSVSNYVDSVNMQENLSFIAHYCEGGALDLNGDGIDDYVFIMQWMGNGLNADLCNVHFLVSDGAGGRMRSVVDGFAAGMDDLVTVRGKTYFRQTEFVGELEKSPHNHWVYQVYAFGSNGVMRCANADFGTKFPAVTIYYTPPKFRQIELTPRDMKKIADTTKPVSCRFEP